MITENHELLMELWSRIKTYIPPKERLEVADTFVAVFDEFGLVEDTILDEELDKELRAAVRSHLVVMEEDEESYDSGEDDDYTY